MSTAAKMILHDWQRGRIPFFVPPPRQQDDGEPSKDSGEGHMEDDPAVNTEEKSAAMRAIASIISAQQDMHVPEKKGFFDLDDEGLEEEEPEKDPPSED